MTGMISTSKNPSKQDWSDRRMAGVERNRRRILWRALVVAFFALLTVGFLGSPAQAHATLEGTDPSPGTIVDTAPTVITLNFSERVVPVNDRIKVIAPNGQNVVKGSVHTINNGARVRIPVNSKLGDGTYLVSYRIISADGHPVSGSLTFSIRVPSELGATASSASTGADVNGAVRTVQSIGRYAAYTGLVLLAGPLVILLGLWPRRLSSSGPRKMAWLGWALLFAGTLDVLVLQQPYADGNSLTAISLTGVGDTVDGTVGRALLTRLGLLVAAIPVLMRVLRSADPERVEEGWVGRVDRILTAVLGLAVLVTFPFAGHAGQSPAPLVSVPAITMHVGAMAVWLGGLAVLARYLLPRARYRELEVIMPVWSRWAFWSVALLVFSGSIETLLEIGGFTHLDYLLNTTYGQLVLTKVIWLGAIMVVAANARAWVRRRFGVPVAYALAADGRSEEPGKAPARKSTPARKGTPAKKGTTAGKAPAKKAPAKKTTTATKAAPAKKAGPATAVATEPTGSAGTSAPESSAKAEKVAAPAGPKASVSKAVKKDHGDETADFSAAGKASDEVRRLRTRVAIEVLLGAVVLGLATALVQVAPARSAGEAAAAAAALPYSSQITMGTTILQVDISPAKTGTNELHLTAFDKSGLPVKVAEWGATADLAAQNLTSQVSVLPLTENHSVGQVDLPYAGRWKFTFTVRTSDIDEQTATRTITVR